MKIAIVGCGFVADQYMSTLVHRSELELVRAYDQRRERTEKFCQYWSGKREGAARLKPASSLAELLSDPEVEMVLNLTNPRSHFDVTRACFEAKKHVYSEKPLAMNVADAEKLVQLAREHGVRLSVAPCNLLGRTAQTLWKCIKDGAIGQPLLVYATFDAGFIGPHQEPWNWTSETGAHWPAKDEFEIGCTFEHAGYLLGCMVAMFGSIEAVTAFASCLVEDKGVEVDGMAPDFTVGCLEFEASRVVARITCGVVAPREKSFLVVGQDGYASVEAFRDDWADVRVVPHRRDKARDPVRRVINEVKRRVERKWLATPGTSQALFLHPTYPHATGRQEHVVNEKKRVDFSLGPLEQAAAIREKRPSRLEGELGVHIVELINALQYPDPEAPRHVMKTRVAPIAPLPWSDPTDAR